jgi:uncharacterized membrane protein YfcA
MMIWGFLITGLLAGICGGFFGIGGAIVIIPALVYIFSFSQKVAQGTTLAAMIPPIGLLAAIAYWKAGHVDLRAAIFIAIGFFVGGLIGGMVVQYLPEQLLRKGFGVVLMIFAVKMLID